MKLKIKHKDFPLTRDIGFYHKPYLDIITEKTSQETIVTFLDPEYITELYDRYKDEITYDWCEDETISIDDFLHSEHILILLGCLNGDGHEVLYS